MNAEPTASSVQACARCCAGVPVNAGSANVTFTRRTVVEPPDGDGATDADTDIETVLDAVTLLERDGEAAAERDTEEEADADAATEGDTDSDTVREAGTEGVGVTERPGVGETLADRVTAAVTDGDTETDACTDGDAEADGVMDADAALVADDEPATDVDGDMEADFDLVGETEGVREGERTAPPASVETSPLEMLTRRMTLLPLSLTRRIFVPPGMTAMAIAVGWLNMARGPTPLA